MPYIAIKAYPKDEETKRRAVEQIQEIFLKTLGCPAPAITISIEEFPPEDFDKKSPGTGNPPETGQNDDSRRRKKYK